MSVSDILDDDRKRGDEVKPPGGGGTRPGNTRGNVGSYRSDTPEAQALNLNIGDVYKNWRDVLNMFSGAYGSIPNADYSTERLNTTAAAARAGKGALKSAMQQGLLGRTGMQGMGQANVRDEIQSGVQSKLAESMLGIGQKEDKAEQDAYSARMNILRQLGSADTGYERLLRDLGFQDYRMKELGLARDDVENAKARGAALQYGAQGAKSIYDWLKEEFGDSRKNPNP